MNALSRPTSLLLVAACFTLLPILSGCLDSGTSDPVDVTPTTPDLKAIVQPMAETGVVGSAGAELEAIAATRPELKADIEALISADGNPAEVKEKANALMSKL